MDSIISSSIEEICYRGAAGISLSSLFSSLNPNPSPALKSSLWTHLLAIPSLQFTLPPRNGAPLAPEDARIRRFEDAERLGVRIVAKEQLRENFVGLYDTPSSSIPDRQLQALHRIAAARSNGITQSELAKEFKIEGKNLFYIVRNLDCRGLIVRQPALVNTKEAGGEGETKSHVTTNLLVLQRYAKRLGVQQRFEINKEELIEGNLNDTEEYEDVGGDGSARESFEPDVLVRDYLPAIKAVCDKLEEANEKVLVVSDLKQELGYTGCKGHKAWRAICNRLKDSCVVEEFDAKVNNKVERCLRLLKTFSPRNFETKIVRCGDVGNNDQMLQFGRRFQQTEQLVELPIDQQIYDMIDAEGANGAVGMEVFERLGLDKKKSYPRYHNMVPRFGMRMQRENRNKTVAFRVWTNKNYNPEATDAFPCDTKSLLGRKNGSDMNIGNLDVPDRSPELFLEDTRSTLEDNFATPGKSNNREINVECSPDTIEDGKTENVQLCPFEEPVFSNEPCSTASNAKLDLVSTEVETNVVPLVTTPSTLLKLPNAGSSQILPHLPLTADGALREQRILERLEGDKFILKPELHRWLVSFEKDKRTTMDRRTVDRILNKLQEEGHCKCVPVNVPSVTNCGRTRITHVVLHSSIQDFPPELLGEIHDKFRSFEKQIRVQALKSKINDSVPVMSGVMRTQIHVDSEEKSFKLEVMRANGFVIAKMVRAKLLHVFLWSYVGSLPGWDAVSSSGPHSHTYKLFSLEAAVKAIPIDLFLQVAGSSQKFDDMIEKCKRGLCLSDLPIGEYKCLMDTQATGRLSVIIDILRRLKLIRLVHNGHPEDGDKVSSAISTHAMELKPYVEEPMSVVAKSLDLRPRIRHDFVLSNKEAVNDYWKTLEYCYAAADPEAALHAFPGSAVPEVFFHRSWTTLRVMSVDQRAELLKRVMKEDVNKKISFKECEKIAKDLNLTLQQVLRVYYDKRHQRLNRFQGTVNTNDEYQPKKMNCLSSSKKRKKYFEPTTVNCEGLDTLNGPLRDQDLTKLPDSDHRPIEEQVLSSSEKHGYHLPAYQEHDHLESVKEPGTKSTRHSRFLWTDEADRQLLIQYAKHRAALGANVHRIDWTKVPDLPATERICARRMASLNRNKNTRKAVMKLCTMLSERYAKHLEKMQDISLKNTGCTVLVRSSTKEAMETELSSGVECPEEAGFKEEQWDDFNNDSIKKAFEDVLHYKRMVKLEASARVDSDHEEWSNLNMNIEKPMDSELVSSDTLMEDIQIGGRGKHNDSAQRSRCHFLHQKFIKLLNERTKVCRQVHESLAVSNAVELLKLVFLSAATAPELQNLQAETLRRYSEHDLFAAFSYLREKNIMIGGSPGQQFVLSQKFRLSISTHPSLANTGRRAAKFFGWLQEQEKDLIEGGTNLSADLQRGDIFQLFALVSSGGLSISPVMPHGGVGEAEDLRGLKRRADDDDICDGDKAKKLKSLADSELFSRREKGFPGIAITVHHTTVDPIRLLEDGETYASDFHPNDKFSAILGQKISLSSAHGDHMQEVPSFDNVVSTVEWSNKSAWEAMASYAEYLISETYDPNQVNMFRPEVFRALCTAIQKAGDQGLSMEEVSRILGNSGDVREHIIDALQAFGRVLKVNAYDSVRVVDSLYHSKYFLTSSTGFPQDLEPQSILESLHVSGDCCSISQPENHDVVVGASTQVEAIMSDHDVHKVTILNLPEVAVPLNETDGGNMHGGCFHDKVVTPVQNNEVKANKLSYVERMPILPWVNGDGTINKVIYNGLVSRVLWTVMKKPGILEDDIIREVGGLNPQSCRSLLELMILDKHLIVRKMYQTVSSGPPALLGTLVGRSFRESNSVYRKHFFANPMSASLL